MVKRKLFIILLGLLVLFSGVGLIYGRITAVVTNDFETGIVDIRLKEYQKDGDTEVKLEDGEFESVLPGDVISKIPRIFNKGNDCYVRAKLTFRGTDQLSDSNLLGITDKWVKADDGYYYYTEIIPHGEDVDIFQAVSIPTNFSQTMEGEQFYLDIAVDAIQSQNFTPDYTLASPWGSVEILENEKDEYEISSLKKSDTQSFQVVYEGDSKKLITNSDDFFANIPYLMPGDTYSDTVKLSNTSTGAIKLYFRSNALDKSDLLDKILLKITTTIDGKTEVFYEGPLRASKLTGEEALGTLPKNSNGTFEFEITVPAELNNKYSVSASSVQWIFSTEPISTEASPKTGDTADVDLFLWMFVISLTAFVVVLIVTKKKTKEDKHG